MNKGAHGPMLARVHERLPGQFQVDEANLPSMSMEDRDRIERILNVFLDDLQPLLAQMAALESLPKVARQVLEVALATDARCQAAVGKIDSLARQFDVLGEQNRQFLKKRGYSGNMLEEMLTLLRRLAGVADFIEDLKAAGLGAEVFRALLDRFQMGVRALGTGDFSQAHKLLASVAEERPDSGAAAAALAADHVAEQRWSEAALALSRAALLRPQDADLAGLRDWVIQVDRESQTPTANPPLAVGEVPAASIVLEVIAGPHHGTHFRFDHHDTFIVGRAPTVNLQLLDDAYFSRHHFLLEFNPPRCYLRDLGSSNGTRVNGQKVTECFLQNGDVISGGKTQMRLTLPGLLEPPTGSYPDAPDAPARSEAPTQPPMPQQREDSWTAQSVPGFEIVRRLGQGGMGVVYLARRLATGQQCALKIILPESAASERLMQLFLREISVLSRLVHPHIVRFQEMGMAQGQFFFAMDYVETIAIENVLARETESVRIQALCGIACQVLEGLSHAHGLGFIHRDIKPTNILVSGGVKQLQARLADFGLAKNIEHAGFSGMTYEGQMRGTLQYMAPEQLIDARSAKPGVDLYSMGATLYHWLARRLPFASSTRKDHLAVILEDPPVPLGQVCATVPAGLADLVHRALAKNPAERFASAEAMRQALLPFAGNPTVTETRSRS